ncbi:hypothetical protein CK203_020103 [Vitis vinifera]|uniref:Uncharacterized protein n=1 Tax=Vitis vinifera TaxID=29760 RepID=A0A438J8C8_VITVI|nr:hypothetical protein CK203_020103 [Vitis vinifera]
MLEAIQYLVSSKKLEDGFGMLIFSISEMLEAIQYLVSSKKLEDGFGMVNGRNGER